SKIISLKGSWRYQKNIWEFNR
ncbi:serine acetyltransferase, partial [Vibrio anguillarum]|nr:serine acetyltransferase [Vibrio anguillarum]